MSESVISHECATYFELFGLISPVVNNKRKISGSTISSAGSRSLSTSSSSSTHFPDPMQDFEVPASLRSVESYVFMGYTEETARVIWQQYLKGSTILTEDPECPLEFGFLECALRHVEDALAENASSVSDDWEACMTSLGINETLKKAILTQEFTDIRYTATCKFWIAEALELSYDALRCLDDRLRMKMATDQHQKKFPRTHPATQPPSPISPISPRPKPATPRSHQPTPPSQPQYLPTPRLTVPRSRKPIQVSQSQQNAPTEDSMKETNPPRLAAETLPPTKIPGHTMLWRAGSKVKAHLFYDKATQEIDLNKISCIPGDFSATNKVVYWTPQKETAERYARWYKVLTPIAELCFIQAAVPEVFTLPLRTTYLWTGERENPTDEWRNLIWHSRRGKDPPTELEHLANTQLLIGHLASEKDAKYEKMTSYQEIKMSDCLMVRIDGEERKAVQWVFLDFATKRGLSQALRGNIWFHDLEGWGWSK